MPGNRGTYSFWAVAVIILTVGLTGCSESNAYLLYTDIPGPSAASETKTPAPEPSDIASADTIAGSSQNEPSDPVTPATDRRADEPAVPSEVSAGTTTDIDRPVLNPGDVLPAVMPTGVHEIKLLVPEKRFRQERNTDAIRVSYDDIDLLKVLNMHPVPVNATDHFPDWLKELDGKRIRILGFMYPAFKARGLKEFVLTRDTGECCFGTDPLIYFLIPTTMRDGETTSYFDNRRIDVEGTFRIDPLAEDNKLYGLYRIEDAIVRSH